MLRKRVKNLNLTVRGREGQVRVSVPLRVNEADVRHFVRSRLDWIRKHQARLAAMPDSAGPAYRSGEQHYFLGRAYRLRLHERPAHESNVVLNGGDCLHLLAPKGADVASRKAIMHAWYREQLGELIPPLIRRYQKRMGVRVAEWRIRSMKTRWGSCNTRARRIWINLELARFDPQCLEYIVVHEMVHLLEHGHNARFYAFMDRFMPDWRQARDMLRQHSLH